MSVLRGEGISKTRREKKKYYKYDAEKARETAAKSRRNASVFRS